MHHRENRLRGALLVKFEQGHGDGPLRHVVGEIDHAVDAADAPVPFPRMAFFGAELPKSIEYVDIGDAVADELCETLVEIRREMQVVVRQLKTFHIAQIGLIVQCVFACILQNTGHFEGRLPQLHRLCLFIRHTARPICSLLISGPVSVFLLPGTVIPSSRIVRDRRDVQRKRFITVCASDAPSKARRHWDSPKSKGFDISNDVMTFSTDSSPLISLRTVR